MSEHEDGGAAFPVTNLRIGDQCYASPGMSLRDYFAAAALDASIRNVEANMNQRHLDVVGNVICEAAATRAYQMADAMLTAREKAEGAP